MQLDDKTREIIKSEVADQLGSGAVVRLFGSLVDNAARGETLIFSSNQASLSHTVFRWNAVCPPTFSSS